VKVEGTREFAAPAQSVWDVLNDPASIASLLPGVASFEITDDTHWSARVKVPLGMGGLKLKFAFEKLEERPIEFARLAAKGSGVGAMVNMDTSFTLTPSGDATTHMAWEADVRVAGPVGAMGQRVLEPIIRSKVDDVMTALDERLAAG
jgi:carbon monoxide dehydrogenase subunit G